MRFQERRHFKQSYPLNPTFYNLHNKTYNSKETRKKEGQQEISRLFVVCSWSNAHKVSVSQTGFTQFQGVFAWGESSYRKLTRNMVGSIGVICRSKINKIDPIGSQRWSPWRPSWKSIFRFLFWTERQLTWNAVGSIGANCRPKLIKILSIGKPRWPPSSKSIFRFCSWTEKPIDFLNSVGSFEMTCRSKIAKIVPIGNPRWPPSWKYIFCFYSWTKRPTALKLSRNYQGDL